MVHEKSSRPFFLSRKCERTKTRKNGRDGDNGLSFVISSFRSFVVKSLELA